MKLTLATSLLVLHFGIINAHEINRYTDKEKSKSKKTTASAAISKNFHSIKKWNIRIEYISGDVISKTIVIPENKTMSVMETAFMEAEKYVKTLKKVKLYNVSPVSDNKYVLLANQ